MNRKKICFIVSSPYTVKAFLINHIKALSAFYDIYLIANTEGTKPDLLNEAPIKHIENIKIVRGISIFEDIIALRQLKKYLQKEKFDAVHTVTPKAGLIGILAAQKARIKIRTHIFTGQVWHTKKGFLKSLLKFMDKIIVKNATEILVDGESQRNFLIENKIITKSKSKVLGKGSISGVNTAKFFPDSNIKTMQRNHLNISKDDVVFMFLGRMNVDKGIKELAIAFNVLSKKYPNTKLLLVGGDEENMTEYITKTVHHKNQLIILKHTDRPEEILQSCDVFCLPSHREGFGLSILEASLLEKPIICSNTYGLSDTILDNITGVRHLVKDPESLFKCMENLYINSEERIKMGKKGREYVLEHYKSETITKEWLHFYKKIFST